MRLVCLVFGRTMGHGMRAAVLLALCLVLILTSCDDREGLTGPAGTLPAAGTAAASATPTEVWQFAAPDRYYTRVAATDQVVVVAAAPEFPQFHPEERFVVALERDSGAVRWRAPLPCAPLYPAVDGERAYLPCNDGLIRAWNLADGSEAWSVDTQGAPVFIIPAGGLLLVADGDPDDGYDLSGVNPPRTPDGRVRAYEVASGALRWELPLQRETAYLALGAETLYVATADRQARGETLAVNPATGEVRWRTATGAASGRPFASADAVFVADGGLHRLSARDGRVEWRTPVPGEGVFEAPVAVGDVVVTGTNVNVIAGRPVPARPCAPPRAGRRGTAGRWGRRRCAAPRAPARFDRGRHARRSRGACDRSRAEYGHRHSVRGERRRARCPRAAVRWDAARGVPVAGRGRSIR